MTEVVTQEEMEQLTNELIALIWPRLDHGASKDEINSAIANVIDSWEPEEQELANRWR